MARSTRRYVCQECGGVSQRWAGRCDGCGAWNTLLEEVVETSPGKVGTAAARGRRVEFAPLVGNKPGPPRRRTGIAELDRVLGGGLVPGSAVLVGGDPGIGKSTLLLQAAASLSADGLCAYVSGEEALDQIRLRAERLGVTGSSVRLAAATNVGDLVATFDGPDAPDVAVIDSIQTMHIDAIESAPGTVSQVRASAQELIRVAKRRDMAVILVGHVTKEGTIAGPRVLEHMVDTVLYFEGERGHQFRILRAVKNRFGPTDEIGVFEMTEIGLVEVENPSASFLGDRAREVSGSAVFAGMEGTRPLLMEIQALVAPSPFGTPRRAVIGWDAGRLAMVTAVLEARCGVSFAGADVFLNVAGGLRITEPAADLAVAAALLSSQTGMPVPPECVVFDEIGLSAEVRPVSRWDARLKEAAKLGFTRAIIPARRAGRERDSTPAAMRITEIDGLDDLVAQFADAATVGRKAARG